MSKSQSRRPSPARSLEAAPPRRARRTLSAASPARSDTSGRLSSIVERFMKEDFVLSPLKRQSVLPDNTEIEAPRRASWWKRLDGSSREVLEALDTNKMTGDFHIEDFEFEVEKDKQNQSVSESSDSESIASIIVPQRRLLNQKKPPQGKFVDIMGRKSLGKTSIEDQSIEGAPKNLFNKGPRNKPVFPAALLNSTNKTINKTVEPEPTKQARSNLFGQAGTKRKNMFTDLILSDSEEDSGVQHKIFGFKKNNSKRISLGTRTRRMPSLTPSMTTEIDIDDWNLLPSSTMIGAQEVSKMSNDLEQGQEENQDETLVEENASLNRDTNNRSPHEKSIIQDDDNDKTLTNENFEQDASKNQDVKSNESKSKKTHEISKSKLNVSGKDKTLQNESSTRLNIENVENIEVVLEKQQNHKVTKNHRTMMDEQSVEDKIAELHGESVEQETNRENILSSKTTENLHIIKKIITDGKGEQEIKLTGEVQEIQNVSKMAENINQDQNNDLPEKNTSKEKLEKSNKLQKKLNYSKNASNTHQEINDICEKHENRENIEPNVYEQENPSKETSNANQDEDMEDEIHAGAEEHVTRDSGESRQTNEVEDINDLSEKENSNELEPSAREEDNEDESNEESDENDDEEMNDASKDRSKVIEPSAHDQESQNDSKEESHDDQDEDMEEMVWNDNDDEKASNSSAAEIAAEAEQNHEIVSNENSQKNDKKDETLVRKEVTNKSRNLTNNSHKIVETSLDNEQIKEKVVEEAPNNSTHDTTGRNRKKDSLVKSPEAVLQNMTIDNESFRPSGRSTTFRKSKSLYEMRNRPSLAPLQESTLGSEGSRNSSTEGSEWDSHRTTRKTIRQTLGKEYTTRKSLRALIMEQSAKRQTELYNKSHINKTKNKTVLEGNDKNASKLNKTKDKTVSENVSDKNASRINKNKTVLEDVHNKNASEVNQTKNNTMLEDVNVRHIRLSKSNQNLSSNQSPILKSPVHETSTHHLRDPLISEPQVSFHKYLHDIREPEIFDQMTYRADSINIPVPENNDSDPEISLNASYGQGMSADTYHEVIAGDKASDVEMKETSRLKDKEASRRNASIRAQSILNSDQEVLDYEASELEKSEEMAESADQENLEQDNSVQESMQEANSEQQSENEEEESEEENEDTQQGIEAESEQEESQHDIEAESEHEESEHSEKEESQQEIESEEESQQEIEIESEHEQSQQSEGEESQQENEFEQDSQEIEQELSQQDIESDQESEEQNDISQPESDQSDQEKSIEPKRDSDDDFVSGLNSKYQNRSGVSRVVFDSQMMSVEEIDFEGVSRQTDNDIIEQSNHESELSRNTLPRVPEPSVQEVSVATKKSMLLMQMQKIAQQNMEIRQKIREKVQKSLKATQNCNIMSPEHKFSVRRIIKEPRQPKKKPKLTGVPMETLPKAFVEDLMYKPPKRYQPCTAPWITKRLYTFLEKKLEPKYDYRARVRAEELVQTIHSFSKLVRRHREAPAQAVDELKREMARLGIVSTHFDFHEFFNEFMPREVTMKVNPDVVNKIPMPRNGIFSEILKSRE